jgi:HMG-box domain
MESLLEVLNKAQKLALDFSNENMYADTQSEFISVNSITPGKGGTPQGIGVENEKPKNWKKPKDMPRRPLSAYNLFFKSERQKIVSSISSGTPQEGKSKKALGIGFAGLARVIASKWKVLESEEKSAFEEQARLEKLRYRNQISVWKSTKAIKKCSKKAKLTSIKDSMKPVSDATISIDCSAFDASDITARSLNKLLQDENLRAQQTQFKNDTGHQMDPIPDLPLSGTRSVSLTSMDCPYGNPNNDDIFGQPAVIEPVLEDNFLSSNDEPYPDSCWKVLVSNLRFESGPSTEQVLDYVDDLADFMETMERECF